MKIKIDQRVVKEVFTNFYGYFVIFLLLVLWPRILGVIAFLYVSLGLIPFLIISGMGNILAIFFGYNYICKKQDKIIFLTVLVIALLFDLAILARIAQALG